MVSARVLAIAGFVVSLLSTAAAAWLIVESPGAIQDVGQYVPPARTPGEAIAVTVRPGQSPQQIGDRLEALGVIDSATQFEVLVALLGYQGMLQAGDYEFQARTPALDVVYRMRQGVLSTRSVTVIEGWRTEEIADAVAAQGIPRQDFLAAARRKDYDFDFLRDLPPGNTLEGFLYPATYPIRATDTARDLVQRMLQAFQDNAPSAVRETAPRGGLTFPQVVTLASIIEREAKLEEERPIMAQVFLSRLDLGFPLQADPTVQYALVPDAGSVGESGYWKQELTLDDLEVDSPYNTYLNIELPPGPISNPGLSSIIAVLQPADTDYLYFVAKPDGSHAFAETLEEHEANVEMYRGQ